MPTASQSTKTVRTTASKLNGAAKPSDARPIPAAIPHAAPQPEVAGDGGIFDEVMKRYHEGVEGLMAFFEVPSWKRTLCAIIAYVAGVSGVIFVGSALVEFVLVGAVSLGASIFLSVVIAAIGACLVAYYGHRAVVRVAGAILTKEADERAVAAYDAMKSLGKRLWPFGKSEAQPTAA